MRLFVFFPTGKPQIIVCGKRTVAHANCHPCQVAYNSRSVPKRTQESNASAKRDGLGRTARGR